MIDHLAVATEKMRVAMRDNYRRGCSKACECEGGWMKACPCLEIAEICAAPLRIHKLFVALRSRSIIKHVRLTQGGGTIPSGGHCALCNAEWNTLDVSVDKIEGREHHAPSCLLAGTEAS